MQKRHIAKLGWSPRRRRREAPTYRKGGEEEQTPRKQKTTGVRLWFSMRADLRHRLVPFNADEVS
jgi:hypothetical protein